MRVKLERINGPLITPSDVPGYGAIFNPGCIEARGKLYLFARGAKLGYSGRMGVVDGFPRPIYENYYSDILLFEGLESPRFIKVLLRGGPSTDHPYGVEDPRVARVGEKYLMTFSDLVRPAFSKGSTRVGLALLNFSKDEFKVEQTWKIGPDVEDRNASLVELEGGRLAFIHRVAPNIQVAFFDSLEELLNPPEGYWRTYLRELDRHILLRPEKGEKRVGAGPPPLRTERGWLLIYHAVDQAWRYVARAALLHPETLSVMARLPYPILEPERDYERRGDMRNVVFPVGAVVHRNELLCTYGGADKVVCAARVELGELLDALAEFER